MHKRALAALKQFESIEEIGDKITSRWPDAKPISSDSLKDRFPRRSLCAGWVLLSSSIQSPKNLILALPDLHPYKLPIIALAEHETLPKMPHVESDGVICLVPEGALTELPVDMRHIDYLVSEAVKVISAGLSGDNRNDFIEEATSYWTIDQHEECKTIWLTSTKVSTRTLHGLHVNGAVVLGDSKKSISEWMKNARPFTKAGSTTKAFHLALPEPLFPESYPSDSADLLNLARATGAEAASIVEQSLHPGRSTYGVISFKHNNQAISLGLKLDVGSKCNIRADKPSSIWHGFRKGHIPHELLMQRIALARFPLIRTQTVQVDGNALLNRTTGDSVSQLTNMRIGIIGCGALGSFVSLLLAQAGIRDITLFDHDLFTWQNIGRHVLTNYDIGRYKADAMKDSLLARFPDGKIRSFPKKWQEVWKDQPKIFDHFDLIISLTADRESDALLNLLCKKNHEIPAIVFGWLEPYAIAGHAVISMPDGGCLNCLSSPCGEFKFNVASIPKEYRERKEASCGAFYQPFSSAAAMPTASLIAKLSLAALSGHINVSEHHTWIGSKTEFDAINATILDHWYSDVIHHGFDRIAHKSIEIDQRCFICGTSI